MSNYLEAFNQVGAEKFAALICKTAPYFSTIDPVFTEFSLDRVALSLKNQEKVHNHLGTVHAIAICNAAELAAGLFTDISIPEGARWIPVGMTVNYLAKAKTDLAVVTQADNVDFAAGGNQVIKVIATDDDTTVVAEFDITMNIKLAS